MLPVLEVFDCSSGEDVRVGTARFALRHGKVSTTFLYDATYLSAFPGVFALDPELPLMTGTLHCSGLPGAFRDSSPDRWGRRLIERERRSTSEAGLPLRQLDEVDYLAGVFDRTREGSLRFREPGGDFLSASPSIPPLVQLPVLLRAARMAAADKAGHEQVKELLDAGSGSLGGARPKASVCDGERLLLAKFSHAGDEWDVMGWEKTALDLARAAGIETPGARLVRVGNEAALLLERFDRECSRMGGKRIAYLSGMTALGSSDGESRDYAELAEAIAGLSKEASSELHDFFRRVTFSVALGNTDDHLRNWGFLRLRGSWTLSPLFDVNPNPYEGMCRATAILGETGEGEVAALKDLAAYAGLDDADASAVVAEVLGAVARWRTVARKNGCREREFSLFEPGFKRREKALKRTFGL
ncbi:type II toxin-antitoxin system HipA family toxin [Eggerthellaceae bacterium zg-893]|nr:type II toxin-antitoxin system HipA family toxin [Eggerthellaceae bacterium zg-893]